MWIFIGLRGHIMSDFIIYYPFYNETCPSLLILFDAWPASLFEPGYVLYASIVKTLGFDYFAFIAISSLIDIGVFAWFFHRYCKSMILPLIFFVAFNGLLMEFNLLRNIKAIDLFLLSFPYLQNRKFLPYLLLNILGFSFHNSAALFIPLYFLLDKKMPKWLIWSSFIAVNIFYFLNISIISDLMSQLSFLEETRMYDKITGYASNSDEFKFSIGYFERTFAFILFSLLYEKLIHQNKSNIIVYNCFWIYYCSLLLFYEVSVLTERIPFLFMFSYWILYPAVTELNFRYRQIISLIISFLVILKIWTSYNFEPCKYENVLFGISDYHTRKNIYEKNV